MPRFIYFVDSKRGNRVFVECISFDRKSESFTDNPDPIKDLGLDEEPVFGYVTNVINRTTNKVEILHLKRSVYNQIATLASTHGDPSDPKTGYDLIINKLTRGLGRFDTYYTVSHSNKITPLSGKEERINLAKTFPEKSYDDVVRDLQKHTHLFDKVIPKGYVQAQVATVTEVYDPLA